MAIFHCYVSSPGGIGKWKKCNHLPTTYSILLRSFECGYWLHRIFIYDLIKHTPTLSLWVFHVAKVGASWCRKLQALVFTTIIHTNSHYFTLIILAHVAWLRKWGLVATKWSSETFWISWNAEARCTNEIPFQLSEKLLQRPGSNYTKLMPHVSLVDLVDFFSLKAPKKGSLKKSGCQHTVSV